MSGECIIYRPYTIDESVIVSGPPDAEAQVYDAGTTYATGDEVWYSGHAWRSKVDSNTGNTPTAGANWADLGEVDQGASAWASGTTYALEDYAVHNHRLWRSTEASNTGNEPTATATQWQDYGPTNRYKAFDENLARYSTSVTSLKWVLEFPDNVVHGTVFSPVGANVSLTKVADGSTIYDETENLLLDGDVDYWGYFFVEPERRYNALFDDMVSIPGETITFEITAGDGDTVAVSGLHFGLGLEIGPVVTGGTGLETKGFITINFDEFGNLISPPRPKQRITRFATRPNIRSTSYIDGEMNAFSQRPCIAFMRDGEDFGLLAWGALDDHVIEMPNPTIAELAVKIKGFPQ